MAKNSVQMKRNKDGKWSIDGVQYMADGGVAANTTVHNNSPVNPMTSAYNPSTWQSTAQSAVSQPGNFAANMANPMATINGIGQQVGGGIKDFANSFVTQNQYQAGLAPTQQYDYSPALWGGLSGALQGNANFNSNQMQQQGLLGQQQQLGQALQNTYMGQGPNPATAMLHNATGQNVANQAALMGSQRGAGANAGLLARQASMSGAAQQQNAIGQAAALQAQQSLQAQQQQQANLQGQGQLLGQMGTQGLQNQQNNAGLFTSAAGANNAQNTGLVQNYGMAQGINSQIAQNNANASNQATGGLLNSVGGLLGLNKGGVVGKDGQKLPDHLAHIHSIYHFDSGGEVPQIGGLQENPFDIGSDKKGGEKPSLSSFFDNGGAVPGSAEVSGNSIKNDKVPAMLSPKEIVLPRSVTLSPDAPEKAKEFVAALLKKQGHGNSKHHKEFKDALKQAILSRKK